MSLTANRCIDTLNELHRQTDEHKKEKNLKKNTVVNAGSPDIEYLYYPVDVEGVTVKGSLLPASARCGNVW